MIDSAAFASALLQSTGTQRFDFEILGLEASKRTC